MRCVVLAGGLGTRMSRFTRTIPKALIPVAGQPFLLWQLENLKRNGVEEVVISTGYLSAQIEEVVGKMSFGGMKTVCVDDGPELLGTAGSVRRLVELGIVSDSFLITYGDSFLTVDHQKVFDSLDSLRFEALMTVCSNRDGYETGNASIAGNEVTVYKKGSPELRLEWIDYGLSAVTASSLIARVPVGEKYDLSTYFEELAFERRLQGYEVADKYFEVGSELGLENFEKYLIGGSN